MSKPNVAGSAHSYEVAIILDAAFDEKKATTLIEKYLKVVKDGEGTVDKIDVWGRRELAYEINNHKEGTYLFVNFTAKSEVTDEFARRLGLEESVIRYKVFREGK